MKRSSMIVVVMISLSACTTSAGVSTQGPQTPPPSMVRPSSAATLTPSTTATSAPVASATVPTATSTPASSPAPSSVASRSISELGDRLLATVDVGGEPEWIGAGPDSIWVTNRGLNGVQQVDPSTNEVTGIVTFNEPCNGVIDEFGSVWTASCQDQKLVRIDPVKHKVSASIPTTVASDGEGQLAAAFGSIWISSGDGHLKRLDPATNKFIADIEVPALADALAAGAASIWLTDPVNSALVEIDPQTNTVKSTTPVGPHPQFLATDADSVWVLNQDDGTVSRVNQADQSVVSIDAQSRGRDVGCIGAGLDSAWVPVPGTPLTRIDAATNTVTEQWTGDGGDCLTPGFGSVWLVNNGLGSVYRIAPPA